MATNGEIQGVHKSSVNELISKQQSGLKSANAYEHE